MVNLEKEFPYLNIKYLQELETSALDILKHEDYQKQKEYIQHGSISIYEHCICVACTSLNLVDKYNLNINRNDLIKASLLHDYFKYDWHTYAKVNKLHKLHGIYHPSYAAKNAREDFDVNTIIDNAIKSHMWPLGFSFPKSLIAWIIFYADKKCALIETILKRRLSSSGRAIHS